VRCGSFIANDRDCSHTVKTYLTLQLGLSDGFAAALTPRSEAGSILREASDIRTRLLYLDVRRITWEDLYRL